MIIKITIALLLVGAISALYVAQIKAQEDYTTVSPLSANTETLQVSELPRVEKASEIEEAVLLPTQGPVVIPESSQAIISPAPVDEDASLRSLAQARGFKIGTAVAAGPLRNDPRYAKTIADEFNIITPENAMKFGPIHPDVDMYNFYDSDAIVDFAESNGIEVHGHTLVWHNQLPSWLTTQARSRDASIRILKNHITTVVGRYKGRISEWDVVNEAVMDDGSLRQNFWLKNIGPEYIEMAFRWAHEADPDALLYYNDYGGEGKGGKSDAIFQLVSGLVKKGVPIHGVGLQMHVCVDTCPSPRDIAANIDRLAGIGLKVSITEMDVRIKAPQTEDKLHDAADVYEYILNSCLANRKIESLIMWGFTSHHSWIQSFFPGWEPALVFDKAYQQQPAYSHLFDTLRK